MDITDLIDESKIWVARSFLDDNLVEVTHSDMNKTEYTLDEYIEEIEHMLYFTKPEYGKHTIKNYILSILATFTFFDAWLINLLNADAHKVATLVLTTGTIASLCYLTVYQDEKAILDQLKEYKSIDIRIAKGEELLEEAREKKKKGKSFI